MLLIPVCIMCFVCVNFWLWETTCCPCHISRPTHNTWVCQLSFFFSIKYATRSKPETCAPCTEETVWKLPFAVLFRTAIFHHSHPPNILLLWRRSWRERVRVGTGQSQSEKPETDRRSDQWKRVRPVFIPAPIPVQEDCFGHRNGFGELSKVHWKDFCLFLKRRHCKMFTSFGWSNWELDGRVITRNWQRLFVPVKFVSLLRVETSLLTILVLLGLYAIQNIDNSYVSLETFNPRMELMALLR